MEKQILIPLNSKLNIYGTLNTLANKSETLIIFVHGLTGNRNEHHYFNAVPFFTSRGFDTFRFDFYPREAKARTLSESSVTTHVFDLAKVVRFFKDKYKGLILIGHSLGAWTVLKSDLKDIDYIVLWDPTKAYKSLKERDIYFSEGLNKYILRWGMDILVSKEMIEEWKEAQNPRKVLENLAKPCKFIFAEHGSYDHWKQFFKYIKVKFESTIIKDSTHCFYEEGTAQKLYEETYQWIRNE